MCASAIKPITYMTQAAKLVAEVKCGPSVASYERLQDALILLSLISHSEIASQKGRWLTQSEMERELRKTLPAGLPM